VEPACGGHRHQLEILNKLDFYDFSRCHYQFSSNDFRHENLKAHNPKFKFSAAVIAQSFVLPRQ
jgi:hypothetical protein